MSPAQAASCRWPPCAASRQPGRGKSAPPRRVPGAGRRGDVGVPCLLELPLREPHGSNTGIHASYSLNSLKGVYIGDDMGNTIGVMKGSTRN